MTLSDLTAEISAVNFAYHADLERTLNYTFKNPSYLEMALTHKSCSLKPTLSSSTSSNGSETGVMKSHNERLEFLGDAVLDLVLSDILMKEFPLDAEGDLTKKRASLVNEMSLNEIALDLKLQDYIQLGKVEKETGLNKNSRLLASCLEAVVGALYIDAGFEICSQILKNLFETRLSDIQKGLPLFEDYKTQLQEYLQKKYHITPEYQLVNTEGPEHQKIFEVEVRIKGKTVTRADGRSKKLAEQNAAKKALEVIHEL